MTFKTRSRALSGRRVTQVAAERVLLDRVHAHEARRLAGWRALDERGRAVEHALFIDRRHQERATTFGGNGRRVPTPARARQTGVVGNARAPEMRR